jgi:putative ABC transport system permease protein
MLESRHRSRWLSLRRWRDLALLGLVAASLIGLAFLSAGDPLFATWFVAGALATLIVFRLLALGVKAAARRLSHRILLQQGRGMLRRALADLAGPRAPTGSVMLALGIGLTVLVGIAMVEGNLRHELEQAMPARAPSFYFIDIQPDEVAAFDKLVLAEPGVSDLQRVPMLRGRITRMRDVPVEQLPPPKHEGWVLQGDRGITWSATLPPGSSITAGTWWPAHYQGPPLVSLDAEVADAFGLEIGDSITVNILGREVTGRIANLRRFDWATLTINFIMVFSPGILESAPQTDIATVRVDAGHELDLQRKVPDRFANV